MARIGADLDQLRATIAAFRQGIANLNETSQRALQAMQSMQSGPWADSIVSRLKRSGRGFKPN